VSHFELGYHDRVENRIMRVPIHDVVFPEENSRVFELIGDDGQSIRIPFHPCARFSKTASSSGNDPKVTNTDRQRREVSGFTSPEQLIGRKEAKL
jgi:hypothetical protein